MWAKEDNLNLMKLLIKHNYVFSFLVTLEINYVINCLKQIFHYEINVQDSVFHPLCLGTLVYCELLPVVPPKKFPVYFYSLCRKETDHPTFKSSNVI
jgi:hypothetical protein